MPDAADPNTPPGDLKHSTRFNTTHVAPIQMGSDTDGSDHQTPNSLKPTEILPNAPNAERTRDTRPEDDDISQQLDFAGNGGKKRRGKKSRKSRKGKKPRKGKKSRKNKRRTKRR